VRAEASGRSPTYREPEARQDVTFDPVVDPLGSPNLEEQASWRRHGERKQGVRDLCLRVPVRAIEMVPEEI
jgi:hypothetical protein